MKIFNGIIALLTIALAWSCQTKENKSGKALHWRLTTPNKAMLFAAQSDSTFQFDTDTTQTATILVDTTNRFQTMDGFGYTLTGGSAQLIHALNDSLQNSLLRELFTTEDDGLGISFLRISIGASDLSDRVFTYNDMPVGKTDKDLTNFSIAEEQKTLIPILKKIIALNPTIKIMGSPWSAPSWMKTNNSSIGGSLRPEYYSVYAQYFVKYLQSMQQEGISLHSITIQNEPENPHNNPSMVMLATEQRDFIKEHLGPAFKKANIQTKIVVFDHNCDHPNYPIDILNDSIARQYVDGSAFHLYAGEPSTMGNVHEAHPDKNIYFTEQWTASDGQFNGDLAWHSFNLLIQAPRNWSKAVLEWNLVADPNQNPHTKGGCDRCLGALTIGEKITRNVSYYIMAHASKAVRPGAVRVESNRIEGVANVAFQNTDGTKVLIVLNTQRDAKFFRIKFGNQVANAGLASGAVATYTWK